MKMGERGRMGEGAGGGDGASKLVAKRAWRNWQTRWT